ncbi:hypothetical protein CHUAL_014174 [Chamberlinius hualienensis]
MFKRELYLQRKEAKMSVSPVVSVVDVYEIATDMGKAIERLMECYGADAMTELMPKVINVLELLESFAASGEQEMDTVDELRCRVAQLEIEKIGKQEDRIRYEKELEQIEDNFKDENRDLLEMISRLQDENKRLAAALKDQAGISSESCVCNEEQDNLLLLQKMKELIENQRMQLRQKENEKQEKQLDFEQSQAHVEKLTTVNKELYRKQRNSQLQTRALIEEKAEMQAQLQDQQRELQALKEKVTAVKKTHELFKTKSPTLPDLNRKVMYDLDDPDRPRFTMNELRKILFERNEYKARISELMDELELLRPKKSDDQSLATDLAKEEEKKALEEEEKEGPVQGPINRDPDDAPWKKIHSNSGIRKLFQVLFGDKSSSGVGVGICKSQRSKSPVFGFNRIV